jgi:hypothetical protein
MLGAGAGVNTTDDDETAATVLQERAAELCHGRHA